MKTPDFRGWDTILRSIRVAEFLFFALPALVVAADDETSFHLHQENSGEWVLESPHATPSRVKSLAASGDPSAFPWGVFRVPAEDETDRTPVSVAGRWLVESDRLLFRPKYTFRGGLRFHVAELHEGASGRVLWEFRIPRGGGPEPRLTEIRPAAELWPANLLRVYLHFNRPMARGEANRRIKMRDESGRTLVQPFLELDQELWDRDGRRLTLLFDPGRVKQGLKPREEDGAILEAGHRYIIEVLAGWPDSRGVPCAEGFVRTIEVTEADHVPITPRKWKVTPPKAKTNEPLVVAFDQPADTGIALRLIGVLESGECPLDGKPEVSADGLTWKFVPNVPWSPGLHFIEVDPALEDPSGNQVGRPFESDLKAGGETIMRTAKPTRLTFVVETNP